jgi:phosphoribosylanthranilate isomerase
MTVRAKICGINSPDAADAAVAGGAGYVGFVFYPPSPRSLTPEAAGALAARVPVPVIRVGLVVDASDETIAAILAACPLEMLQLHGSETPARAAEIRARFRLPVMKAIAIAAPGDANRARAYQRTVDWLLFDAKPPKPVPGELPPLPGGNARSFDWTLLAGLTWQLPWMLSGGLTAENVAEAVRTAHASVVDVSSGVEDRPGVKNPDKIRRFLETVARL